MSVDHELFVSVKAIHLKPQGAGSLAAASAHNKRCLSPGPNCRHDPARSHLNQSLFGLPDSPEGVLALAHRLMTAAGIAIKGPRTDTTRIAEFVFSLDSGSAVVDMVRYFGESALWAAEYLGGLLLSANIHRDEAAPHCHVLVLMPLLPPGITGSKLIGGLPAMRLLKASFFGGVATKHGLHMPVPRLAGNAKRDAEKQVREAIGDLTDPTIIRRVWEAICKSIAAFPDPWATALGIERQAVVVPIKSLRQLANSSGAGEKKAAAQTRSDRRLMDRKAKASLTASTSIEVGLRTAPVRLPSCVDVGDLPAVPSPTADHARPSEADPTADTREPREALPPQAAHPTAPPDPPEYTRHRDEDLNPDDYDTERGEYLTRQVQTQSGKVAVNAWTAAKLAALTAAKTMRFRADAETEGEALKN